MKSIYHTLLILAAVTLISCASPEEKWLKDYKAAKCEEQDLNLKIQDDIRKDLKDTLSEKETLEKDLKQLIAPDEKKIEGFKAASILKRASSNGAEFLVITVWDSLEFIKKFAGEEIETAVVPPTVQKMMVEFDEQVIHYEVIETYRSSHFE